MLFLSLGMTSQLQLCFPHQSLPAHILPVLHTFSMIQRFTPLPPLEVIAPFPGGNILCLSLQHSRWEHRLACPAVLGGQGAPGGLVSPRAQRGSLHSLLLASLLKEREYISPSLAVFNILKETVIFRRGEEETIHQKTRKDLTSGRKECSYSF